MDLRRILTIIIFFGILGVSGLLTLLLPKQEFSEDENRVLATAPSIKSIGDIIERRFMEKTDDFLSDHFPFRTAWIGLKTRAEILNGKKEINGVYILKDKLIQKVETQSPVDVSNDSNSINALTDRNINAVNQFAFIYPDKKIFMMLIPTAAEIYRNELPVNAPNPDQKSLIDKIHGNLDPVITKLNAYTPLQNEKKNYIFFKTDHHWTSYGAYTVYNHNAKPLGLIGMTLDDFAVQYASYDFNGTLYSKTMYSGVGADVLDIYYPRENAQVIKCVRIEGDSREEYDSMFFMEQIEKKDKYAVFLGTNTAIVTINTSANNGRKLLVFKDSFAHSIMQFLAPHYEEITLVDMRYTSKNTYLNNIDVNNYNNILFLYNVGQFISDSSISEIARNEEDRAESR